MDNGGWVVTAGSRCGLCQTQNTDWRQCAEFGADDGGHLIYEGVGKPEQLIRVVRVKIDIREEGVEFVVQEHKGGGLVVHDLMIAQMHKWRRGGDRIVDMYRCTLGNMYKKVRSKKLLPCEQLSIATQLSKIKPLSGLGHGLREKVRS
jgi:hypothetical protein